MDLRVQHITKPHIQRSHASKKRDFKCCERLKIVLLKIIYIIFPCIKTHNKRKNMSFSVPDTFSGYGELPYDYDSYHKQCKCTEEKEEYTYDRRFEKSLISKKDLAKFSTWEWSKTGGLWGLFYREDYEREVFSKLPKSFFYVKIEMNYDKERKAFVDTFQVLNKKQIEELRQDNILDTTAKVIKVQHYLFRQEGVEISPEEKKAKKNPQLLKV